MVKSKVCCVIPQPREIRDIKEFLQHVKGDAKEQQGKGAKKTQRKKSLIIIITINEHSLDYQAIKEDLQI